MIILKTDPSSRYILFLSFNLFLRGVSLNFALDFAKEIHGTFYFAYLLWIFSWNLYTVHVFRSPKSEGFVSPTFLHDIMKNQMAFQICHMDFIEHKKYKFHDKIQKPAFYGL